MGPDRGGEVRVGGGVVGDGPDEGAVGIRWRQVEVADGGFEVVPGQNLVMLPGDRPADRPELVAFDGTPHAFC